MKKFYFIIILLLFCPKMVLASGSISPSTTSLSIVNGSSTTFKITASNSVGKVDIYSTDTSVATVDKSSEFIDNSTITVTVTGKSAGTAKIIVALSDAATYDEEELSGSYTITVNVSEKTVSSSSNTTTKEVVSLSTNTNLSSLSVSGYDLVLESSQYYLTVGYDVDSIELLASAEDTKASVTGYGVKDLTVGLNTFSVVVTSESGSTKAYVVNVTKKDSFYLDDLMGNLNVEVDLNIKINSGDVITEEMLMAISESDKIVYFNYFEDDFLIYSWIFDGALIESDFSFDTGVEYSFQEEDEIEKLSNYAFGVYLNFNNESLSLSGVRLKFYVGDYYSGDSSLNLYYLDSLDGFVLNDSLDINDDYVEFDLEDYSSWLFTKSSLNSDSSSVSTIYIVVSFIIELCLILIVQKVILKCKRRKSS